MSNKNANDLPVQGAEVVTEKTRKISTSATIKGYKTAIKNMEEAKLATADELKPLKELYNTVYQRWMGGLLEI